MYSLTKLCSDLFFECTDIFFQICNSNSPLLCAKERSNKLDEHLESTSHQ